MAVIRSSVAGSVARGAVVLDLGDLHREGERLTRLARERADEILAQARAEREEILAGAAEEGRREGVERGLGEGRERGRGEGFDAVLEEARPQLDRLAQTLASAIEGVETSRGGLLSDAKRDVLHLAVAIAERIVKRAIAIHPDTVADQLDAVLGVVVRPTELVLSIHPDDRASAARALPGLLKRFESVRHAELVDDASLDPGSVVARARGTGGGDGAARGGEIDASISSQLDRIVEALLPGLVERDDAA